MLHIVLFLLKIIGIILASILGLLIFLILVVLLVPIRYRMNADNRDEIRAEAKISWLLRIIYVRIFYYDNELLIRLKIFGRVFYDSSNPKNKEEPNQKSVKRIHKKEMDSEVKTETDKIQGINNKTSDTKSDKKETEQTVIKKVQSEERITEKTNKYQSDKIKTEIINKEPGVQAAEVRRETYTVKTLPEDAPEAQDAPEDTKEGFFAGVKRFFLKIKAFFVKLPDWFRKIKEKFLNLKEKILDLKEKILNLKEKWDRIKLFLTDESNKKAFSKSLRTFKKVLKHIRPKKLQMELEFGTGDPCSTGQILGVLAVFYSFYGKSMQVIPNFEEEILEGSISCIGRIRLFTLLIICIQLILDKNFRNLLKNLKTLKEDL